MPQYRAREAIYLSNERRIVAPGEMFESDHPPGLAWVPVAPIVVPPVAKAPLPVVAPVKTTAHPAKSREPSGKGQR